MTLSIKYTIDFWLRHLFCQAHLTFPNAVAKRLPAQLAKDGDRSGEEARSTNSIAGRNWTLGFTGFASDGSYGYVINQQEGTPCLLQGTSVGEAADVQVQVPAHSLYTAALSPQLVLFCVGLGDAPGQEICSGNLCSDRHLLQSRLRSWVGLAEKYLCFWISSNECGVLAIPISRLNLRPVCRDYCMVYWGKDSAVMVLQLKKSVSLMGSAQ